MLKVIIIVAVAIVVCLIIEYALDSLHHWAENKLWAMKRKEAKKYEWRPTYDLDHRGMRVFNIPFYPYPQEVFYIENHYDEAANRFVKENKAYIETLLATKGFTFVYLPDVRIAKEEANEMVAYACPDGMGKTVEEDFTTGLKSDFLLDYMVFPENREKIKSGFAWYNRTESWGERYKKDWYVFDFITFDGSEAVAHPKEVLQEILVELGQNNSWIGGLCYVEKPEPLSFADENFGDSEALSDEDRQQLEDIKIQLEQVRRRGISETVIAKYIAPRPKLSRMTITSDFHIILNDYKDMEIKMEPIIKAVYLLFLRHPEGIRFKDLSDHQVELQHIYDAIRSKRNDIDERMKAGVQPSISAGVAALTNPLSNAINEKCTRVKEAFVQRFHDSMASHYYITGYKAGNKEVTLPQDLIIWEDA